MDTGLIWLTYVGGDYSPKDALQEASERGLSLSEIVDEVMRGIVECGHLTRIEALFHSEHYMTVKRAIYDEIDAAFERQAPNL